MSAFLKDVQNIRVGTELEVSFWPYLSVYIFINVAILNVSLALKPDIF